MVFRMVTDGNTRKVRYYSWPDRESTRGTVRRRVPSSASVQGRVDRRLDDGVVDGPDRWQHGSEQQRAGEQIGDQIRLLDRCDLAACGGAVDHGDDRCPAGRDESFVEPVGEHFVRPEVREQTGQRGSRDGVDEELTLPLLELT